MYEGYLQKSTKISSFQQFSLLTLMGDLEDIIPAYDI
jgi:hypothetical protein